MRLTKEDKFVKNVYHVRNLIHEDLDIFATAQEEAQAINKLGKLEDIEDGLGIELIVLFKTKTVWCKTLIENKQTKERSYQIIERNLWGVNLEYKEIMVGSQYSFSSHKIQDYGKTWAFTKEELCS